MKINCVIGIDPGANGGIAIYIPGQYRGLYEAKKMPKDVADFRDLMKYFAENYSPIVFLEKLSVRPDDVTEQDGKANLGKLYRIQKMMANYEQLKAILEAVGIPYVMVHPASWQTKLKLRIKGEHLEKDERKHRYQKIAAEWYPGIKVTLWNADALLIMHFGRWALVNDVNWIKANLPEREHQKLF